MPAPLIPNELKRQELIRVQVLTGFCVLHARQPAKASNTVIAGVDKFVGNIERSRVWMGKRCFRECGASSPRKGYKGASPIMYIMDTRET